MRVSISAQGHHVDLEINTLEEWQKSSGMAFSVLWDAIHPELHKQRVAWVKELLLWQYGDIKTAVQAECQFVIPRR